MSNGIRAATSRICGNRLPIAEIHDRQQHDDRCADRHNISKPNGSKWDQNCKSCFRSVSCRAESVETKDRHTSHWPNFLFPLLSQRERPTKNQIYDGHVRMLQVTCFVSATTCRISLTPLPNTPQNAPAARLDKAAGLPASNDAIDPSVGVAEQRLTRPRLDLETRALTSTLSFAERMSDLCMANSHSRIKCPMATIGFENAAILLGVSRRLPICGKQRIDLIDFD